MSQDTETLQSTDTFSEDEKEPAKAGKKKRTPLSYIREALLYVVLFAVCLYVMPNYVVQRTLVDGESMENTLHDKENLLVDKLSYRFTDPKRYDIIVFYPKGREVKSKYYVKRIYGLPGETIQIRDNTIYINGEPIEDPYAKDVTGDGGVAEEGVTLADDEYFVLGDNREVSLDSRASKEEQPGAPGFVKMKNIAGKVILRIWPLDKFGVPD